MIKFSQVGTKHKSYINRFESKIGHLPHFEIEFIDSHKIHISSKGEKLISFTSKTTFNQFINTLISFNMIEPDSRGYKVLVGVFDWNAATNAIFANHSDNKINILRNSRKISLLAKLDLLNDTFFPIKIEKTKGDFKKAAAISEASLWEHKTMENIDRTIDVLKRIKNEYKI